MDISILILLFEFENWHFNSEICNFTWKLKFQFWITVLESKFYILIQKIIDWVLKVFSISVIHNKLIFINFYKFLFLLIISYTK